MGKRQAMTSPPVVYLCAMKTTTQAIFDELFERYPALEACRADVQAAFDELLACYRMGGKVLLPGGTYLCGGLLLKSGVDLHLGAGATLLGSRNLRDYAIDLPQPCRNGRVTNKWSNAIIRIVAAHDVAVTGEQGSMTSLPAMRTLVEKPRKLTLVFSIP